ncbi:hypothetical protein Geu3261_0240_009 [Komagataeibacter europaeus NBRC 3261]|uniref:Uncharacterized protein n=1 Tax=Komagataeibacter europaeus NBRC 3261 TaxID=1234669 RepID=A0A0D6Q2S8_KOMEU|nr:hypothetical protein Geu3261_0240_009 [Komagataeibacter europaeus NBRC 3261]
MPDSIRDKIHGYETETLKDVARKCDGKDQDQRLVRGLVLDELEKRLGAEYVDAFMCEIRM